MNIRLLFAKLLLYRNNGAINLNKNSEWLPREDFL